MPERPTIIKAEDDNEPAIAQPEKAQAIPSPEQAIVIEETTQTPANMADENDNPIQTSSVRLQPAFDNNQELDGQQNITPNEAAQRERVIIREDSDQRTTDISNRNVVQTESIQINPTQSENPSNEVAREENQIITQTTQAAETPNFVAENPPETSNESEQQIGTNLPERNQPALISKIEQPANIQENIPRTQTKTQENTTQEINGFLNEGDNIIRKEEQEQTNLRINKNTLSGIQRPSSQQARIQSRQTTARIGIIYGRRQRFLAIETEDAFGNKEYYMIDRRGGRTRYRRLNKAAFNPSSRHGFRFEPLQPVQQQPRTSAPQPGNIWERQKTLRANIHTTESEAEGIPMEGRENEYMSNPASSAPFSQRGMLEASGNGVLQVKIVSGSRFRIDLDTNTIEAL